MHPHEIFHLVDRGIAHVVDVNTALFEKNTFERKNGKNFVNVCTQKFYAILLPRPHFRGDVIINRYGSLGLYIFGNGEIEPGIVHKNHHIGTNLHYFLLTPCHSSENGSRMHHDTHHTHVSYIAIITKHLGSRRFHKFSAVSIETCIAVVFAQRVYEVGGMKISACLSGYNKIFHCSMPQFLTSSASRCEVTSRVVGVTATYPSASA